MTSRPNGKRLTSRERFEVPFGPVNAGPVGNLHELTAADAARLVRSGEVAATEIVTHHLDRAEASQPALNAFTTLDRDRALAQAAAVDRTVARAGDPGPLAGVPVALKDLFDQRGLPTTAGSAFYSAVAANDSPVVERLSDAGAVIIGRTGLHEFAYGFTSENPWFGPVRNPWDPATSTGGSSGGSGAAVAARLRHRRDRDRHRRLCAGAGRDVRCDRAQGDPRCRPPDRCLPAGSLARHRRSAGTLCGRPGAGAGGDRGMGFE